MSKLVERFGPDERFPHMTMAICFILLAVSGMGLFSKDLSFLTAVMGGPFIAKWLHLVAGSVFACCNLYFIFRWRNCMTIKEHDIAWLKEGGGLFSKGAHGKLPPSGRFNGGQKVLFRVTMSLGLLLAVTGLFIWFPKILPKALMAWLYPLHALLALGLMTTMLAHIYMAIWFVPGSFRSMWGDGMVEEAWMKYHHRKYYDYKTTE